MNLNENTKQKIYKSKAPQASKNVDVCAQKQEEEAEKVVNLNGNEIEHNKLDLRTMGILSP